MISCLKEYEGFEIGPIRPPSESESLLLRVTRNCPWNQCRFCGLYKEKKFSIRPKEHVLRDIDLIKECIDVLKGADDGTSYKRKTLMYHLRETLGDNEGWAYPSAVNWYRNGMKSIFYKMPIV